MSYLVDQVKILFLTKILQFQLCFILISDFQICKKKLNLIKCINKYNCRQCEVCEKIGGGERFERLQTSC